MSGFIVIQTAAAQALNPHPAHEALKGLPPFIGNWAGEFEAIGGFEGLAKGKMIKGTERVRWILKKRLFSLLRTTNLKMTESRSLLGLE